MADQQPNPNKPAQPPKAAAPKPSPRASGELGIDPVMAELVRTSAQATSKTCPQCKAFMKQEAVLCTTCGYSLQTGKTMATRVTREKAPEVPKDEESPRKAYAGFEFLDALPSWVYAMAPFLLGAAPLTIGARTDMPALMWIGAGFSIFFYLAIWIWTTVAGFRNGALWGIATVILVPTIVIVRLFVPGGRWFTWGPVLLMIYFIWNVQDDDDLKWAWGGMVLLNVGLVLAIVSTPVEEDPGTAGGAV
jgi:hypothetical protein